MKKLIKILTLAFLISFAFSTNFAFAANGDVYTSEGNFYATSSQLALSKAKGNQVLLSPNKYKYEYENKFYSIKDLSTAFSRDKKNFLTVLKNNFKPVDSVDTDFEVIGIE